MPRKPAPDGEAFLVVVLVAEHEVHPAEAGERARRAPSSATTRCRRRTPPYSAASGCSPTARSSKPRRVRNRNHQRDDRRRERDEQHDVGRRAVERARTHREARQRAGVDLGRVQRSSTLQVRGDEIVQQREHDEVEHDRRDHFVRAELRLERAGHSPPRRRRRPPRRRRTAAARPAPAYPTGNTRPTSAATNPPAASCPSAPMLNSPARRAQRDRESGERERRRLVQHLAEAVRVAPRALEQQPVDAPRATGRTRE